MSLRTRSLFRLCVFFLLSIAAIIPLWAQSGQAATEALEAKSEGVSPQVRNLPEIPRASFHRAIPLFQPHAPSARAVADPAIQVGTAAAQASSASNFEGIPDVDGVAPPDTNASVSPTQIVETVNTSFAVWNKTNLLAPAAGPKEVNSIWAGTGSSCDPAMGLNQSDPVVLWDKINSRWVILQIVYSGNFRSNFVCLAVSATSDATGAYLRYSISFGSNLPDYPKLGIWNGAYYLTANIFFRAARFTGPQICGLNSAALVAGASSSVLCQKLSTAHASLLPSDIDGTVFPAAGSAAYAMEIGSTSSLNLFRVQANFSAGTLAVTGPTAISVPGFSQACNGGACIPQPGVTQLLDSLADRLMFRLAWRNLGGTEHLLVNHSVTAGSVASGARWYDIINPAGTASVAQTSTFTDGSNSFWMGSIAMDKVGNVGLGFSASNGSTTFPSLWFTGHQNGLDAPGVMEAPSILFAGSGSQNGGLSRWGDYSSMSVDPVDDCTLWFASEYLPANGSFNWHTRIGSIKFPNCL